MDVHHVIASITEGLSAVFYLVLFVFSGVLYFGRHGHNILHHFTCFKFAFGKYQIGVNRKTVRSRLPLYILINLFCFFLLFRAVGGVLYSLAAVSKSEIPPLYAAIMPVVIVGDYFGFMLFVPIFSALVIVWLQVGITWSTNSTLVRIMVYSTLALCNVAVLLSFIAMTTLQILRAVAPDHIPSQAMSIAQNFVAAPLMVVVLLVLTALTVVLVIRVALMLRQSIRFGEKHSRDSKHMYQQKVTMIKCVIAVLTLNAALLIRAGGFILMALGVPLWLPPMLGRYLPEYLSGMVIILVFWPFRLPSCGSCTRVGKRLMFLEPINFAHDNLDVAISSSSAIDDGDNHDGLPTTVHELEETAREADQEPLGPND